MRKQSGTSLEFMFKKAMDITPDCFAIINQQDIIVYCNNVFSSLFGLKQDPVIGKKNRELLKTAWATKQGVIIKSNDFDRWYHHIETLQGEKTLSQFEIGLTDGRWFKITRVNLKNGYMVIYGVNITDLKNTQQSLEKANQQIEFLANTDQLTGVNNRRAFELIAEREIKKTRRYQNPLSLLIIDLDYFKKVNDQYGHESGDFILNDFAMLCQKLIRQSDSLCRIGGEEFTVLLPMTDETGAYNIAEKISNSIAAHDFYLKKQNCHVKISVSIGLSFLTEKTHSIDELLVQADSALYKAKGNGRNQVVKYSKPIAANALILTDG